MRPARADDGFEIPVQALFHPACPDGSAKLEAWLDGKKAVVMPSFALEDGLPAGIGLHVADRYAVPVGGIILADPNHDALHGAEIVFLQCPVHALENPVFEAGHAGIGRILFPD